VCEGRYILSGGTCAAVCNADLYLAFSPGLLPLTDIGVT
jgi:hypothetical protein